MFRSSFGFQFDRQKKRLSSCSALYGLNLLPTRAINSHQYGQTDLKQSATFKLSPSAIYGLYHPIGYERVYLPLCEVADSQLNIHGQGVCNIDGSHRISALPPPPPPVSKISLFVTFGFYFNTWWLM